MRVEHVVDVGEHIADFVVPSLHRLVEPEVLERFERREPFQWGQVAAELATLEEAERLERGEAGQLPRKSIQCKSAEKSKVVSVFLCVGRIFGFAF